jgi:hypothetical protein
VVLAPGLLGPVPLPADQVPDAPVLSRLLSLGRPQREADDRGAMGTGGFTQSLLRYFGAEASAPYARAADDPGWDRAGFVLHADPVHLRADRDQLRLFDASQFSLEREEAEALVAALNREFADDGFRLSAPSPSRWYLEPSTVPALEAPPLDAVSGCSIDSASPGGADAKYWAALLSEVQMALFQSPVNAERERRGQPAINALWLSGGGTWRPLAPSGFRRLVSTRPLACGLADAAGLAVDAAVIDATADSGRSLAGSLVVADSLQQALQTAEPLRWAEAISALDDDLAPALTELRRGALAAVEIDLLDGRGWRLERRDLRRFWRRRQPFAELLDEPSSGADRVTGGVV